LKSREGNQNDRNGLNAQGRLQRLAQKARPVKARFLDASHLYPQIQIHWSWLRLINDPHIRARELIFPPASLSWQGLLVCGGSSLLHS
jgi:hypothetical protein